MSDVDEHLLTAAKLGEQIRGRMESPEDLHPHTGIVDDEKHRSTLSFVESILHGSENHGSFAETELGAEVLASFRSDRATDAVSEGNGSVLSHLVGVTEQDVEADQVRLVGTLLEELGATRLTTVLLAGEPNTGKTNFGWLLCELARQAYDDLLVISNAQASAVDLRTASAHDLLVNLIEYRETPKVVLVDEGSRHFDARHKSYEVSSQWTPIHKAMSKLGVVAVIVIGHTGKDVAPEVKRITSLAGWKTAKDVVDLYRSWPADDDRPDDPLISGEITSLEKSDVVYSPDDPAPWTWDLDPDVFDGDYSWSQMREVLESQTPQTPTNQ